MSGLAALLASKLNSLSDNGIKTMKNEYEKLTFSMTDIENYLISAENNNPFFIRFRCFTALKHLLNLHRVLDRYEENSNEFRAELVSFLRYFYDIAIAMNKTLEIIYPGSSTLSKPLEQASVDDYLALFSLIEHLKSLMPKNYFKGHYWFTVQFLAHLILAIDNGKSCHELIEKYKEQIRKDASSELRRVSIKNEQASQIFSMPSGEDGVNSRPSAKRIFDCLYQQYYLTTEVNNVLSVMSSCFLIESTLCLFASTFLYAPHSEGINLDLKSKQIPISISFQYGAPVSLNFGFILEDFQGGKQKPVHAGEVTIEIDLQNFDKWYEQNSARDQFDSDIKIHFQVSPEMMKDFPVINSVKASQAALANNETAKTNDRNSIESTNYQAGFFRGLRLNKLDNNTEANFAHGVQLILSQYPQYRPDSLPNQILLTLVQRDGEDLDGYYQRLSSYLGATSESLDVSNTVAHKQSGLFDAFKALKSQLLEQINQYAEVLNSKSLVVP